MAHHKNIRVHGRSVKRKRHRKTKREREARKEKAAMLARIQILIDKAEHDMAAMIGANLYKRYRLRLCEADMKQDVVLPLHE